MDANVSMADGSKYVDASMVGASKDVDVSIETGVRIDDHRCLGGGEKSRIFDEKGMETGLGYSPGGGGGPGYKFRGAGQETQGLDDPWDLLLESVEKFEREMKGKYRV